MIVEKIFKVKPESPEEDRVLKDVQGKYQSTTISFSGLPVYLLSEKEYRSANLKLNKFRGSMG
jgi:hypothetical protein